MTVILLVVAAILCIVALILYGYTAYNQRQLTTKLKEMLKKAQSGEFREEAYDETLLSSVETQMAAYLSANQLTTDQKRESQRQLQGLISDISHQTKTPIANLKLYTELLDEMDLPGEAKPAVKALKGQTGKLEFLLSALVKMSRLENGMIQVTPERQSIVPMIQQVITEIEPKAERKQIRIINRITKEQAWFDEKWTTEALYNLADNAVKYTKEGGNVTIDMQRYDMFLRINVTDTGMGIEEEELAKIFSRFYRGKEVSQEEGVGVGLYLAREIISKEGGYIKVQSKVGTGSTFSIYLPLNSINSD